MSQNNYDLCNDNFFQQKPTVIVGERRFYLNSSKSKFVAIRLSYNLNFAVCIRISGNKNDEVNFNESEWKEFLEYQGIITNYLYSNDKNAESVDGGNFWLEFLQLRYCNALKITKDNSSVYLSYDTICNLWNLIPLIKYRVNMLKNQQFTNYFKMLRKGLQNMDGDININTWVLISPEDNPNSENISTVMEFMTSHPEAFKKEIENKQ